MGQLGDAGTYVFISVDVSGSTKFENSHPDKWLEYFDHFLTETPRSFRGDWLRLARVLIKIRDAKQASDKIFIDPPPNGSPERMELGGDFECYLAWLEMVTAANSPAQLSVLQPPVIWKTLGDEIIFVKYVSHLGEVILAAATLLRFLGRPVPLMATSQLRFADELPLKGNMWVANVGLHSRQRQGTAGRALRTILRLVNPRKLDKTGSQRAGTPEFIGSEIDEGFRVAKYAENGYAAVTLSVALILMSVQQLLHIPRFRYSFQEGSELKGLLNGKKYPELVLFTKDLGSYDQLRRRRCSPENLLWEFLTADLIKPDGTGELPWPSIIDEEGLPLYTIPTRNPFAIEL